VASWLVRSSPDQAVRVRDPKTSRARKLFGAIFLKVIFSGHGKRFSKRPKTARILTRVFQVVFSGL